MMKKIMIYVCVFVFFSSASFAKDHISWSPRMFASGTSASLGDLLSVARAIADKEHIYYGSYYYYNYNYDSHSEKNVYMNDNTISAMSDGVSYTNKNNYLQNPHSKDGGRMTWEWEFK